jgi:Ca2+-binding RTX toxin-like protein
VIYNTTSGELLYDADGTGAGEAFVIATLASSATLVATDIEVVNGTAPQGQTFNGTSGADTINGTEGNDTIYAGFGADTVFGHGGNDYVGGNGDDDWLDGGAGQDTVAGGSGRDSFVFRHMGTANADALPDFATNWDSIHLDRSVFTEVGATRFESGDDRFHAAAGATGGADAEDRIVFNSSTGQLYYDADGSGAGAAELIATVGSGRTVAAIDIEVFG